MAEIVLALASSHGPMLGSPAADILQHGDRDRRNPAHLDRDGASLSYEALLEGANPSLAEQLLPAVIDEKSADCQESIGALAQALADARPDVVIVVGDDQKEQFLEDNQPAMLIYSGETIENTVLPLPATAPSFWKQARAQYHEETGPKHYPVAAAFARYLTTTLVESGFDISHSEKLPRERGEGHAYGFVHRRLMVDRIVPIIPVMLNTYHPPNQPIPARCFALGQALAAAVRGWPEDIRVAFVASGGLSHFTVDPDLDQLVMSAFLEKDGETLGAIPRVQLNSGNSEIRNWITVAGAAGDLTPDWHRYIPFYRTPAGTGCGMGFAVLNKN